MDLTFFALCRFDLPIESYQVLLSYVDLLIVCIELTAGLLVPLFGVLTLSLSPVVVRSRLLEKIVSVPNMLLGCLPVLDSASELKLFIFIVRSQDRQLARLRIYLMQTAITGLILFRTKAKQLILLFAQCLQSYLDFTDLIRQVPIRSSL